MPDRSADDYDEPLRFYRDATFASWPAATPTPPVPGRPGATSS
ncbi:MAG: hypothetical protein ACRDXD_06250 [Acidimicrobiia bacterium]